VDQTIADRYAAPPRWRRRLTVAVVTAVALAGLGWVAWAAYDEATPKVQSALVTFRVDGEHSVSARVDVRVASGTTGASCTVEALAADHSIVGELHFRPVDGSNDVTVRTERAATSVQLAGCTAHGQDRPR